MNENDLRPYIEQRVQVTVFDTGLKHTYEGTLRWDQMDGVVLVGDDQVFVECIRKIEPMPEDTDTSCDWYHNGE